jgi:hypothetical protein
MLQDVRRILRVAQDEAARLAFAALEACVGSGTAKPCPPFRAMVGKALAMRDPTRKAPSSLVSYQILWIVFLGTCVSPDCTARRNSKSPSVGFDQAGPIEQCSNVDIIPKLLRPYSLIPPCPTMARNGGQGALAPCPPYTGRAARRAASGGRPRPYGSEGTAGSGSAPRSDGASAPGRRRGVKAVGWLARCWVRTGWSAAS